MPFIGASSALDDTRREAPHLAGVLCVDIHGFDTQTSTEQARSRSVLIEALREALADMAPSSWWQIDVQHGILIVCPTSPDDVMYVAQCLLHHHERYRWRAGLHVGLLHTVPDLEGRAQTVGDGVARARLIASHASPAQAVATRAYVDAVRDSRPGYSAVFVPAAPIDTTAQSPQAAESRAPERWVVAPSADWLITLRDEVIRRSISSQSRRLAAAQAAAKAAGVPNAASSHNPNPSEGSPHAAAPSAQTQADASPWAQARDLIARWFVPVNALLVSIGLLLSQGYRVGLTERRLLWVGLTLLVLAVVWLLLTRQSRTPAVLKGSSAAAWVGLSYGALLSLGATAALMFTPPQLATSGLGNAATPRATTQPQPPSPPLTSPIAGPTASPAAALAAPAAEVQAKPPPPRVVAAVPSPRAAPAQIAASGAVRPPAETRASPTAISANAGRCNAIVARSALGEPLSPEDRQELLTSCR